MDIISYILVLVVNAFLLYTVTTDAKLYNIYLNKKMKIIVFLFAPIFIIWYLLKRNKVIKTIKYHLIQNSQETEPLELSQVIDMIENKQISQECYIKTNICSELRPIIAIPQLRPFFNLPRFRNWFVTLCILICLIFNLLIIIFSLFFHDEISELYPLNYLPFFMCIHITIFLGFCLLFDWKKLGFWIIIIAQSIIEILLFVVEPDNGIIQIIIYPFLLFGILNIHKNGISTWEQLK
jgi:hypothetical protein